MKFVSASYVFTKEFNDPAAWVFNIRFYTGILEALSINNSVISVEQIDFNGEYFKNGVDYRFKRLSKLGRYLPVKLHRFIKKQNPDVVFIQGLHFPLQVILLRFHLGRKVKIMVQNHAEKPFTGIKKHLQRWASYYVDAYLFASYAMGVDWVDKGNLVSAQKIHEVMEVSSVFYPVKKSQAIAATGVIGKPAFLWVGRLDQNKDPLNVISAFLKFTNSYPFAVLYMIYGTDELLPKILEILESHPRIKSIVLIGKIPNDELLYWYNSVDFILSGSHYEGSGTAVCEAMSCGCVPVVTDISSFRMITDNGKCGLLYEPGSENALLAALIQSQEIDLQQKRDMCLEYYKSNLSFEAIAQRIEKIAVSL